MVTFFESYEQELEKYRTETLFSQLSAEVVVGDLLRNTWIDFDYHRENDGHRGSDDLAPQGAPLCEPEGRR
jgi:hypothetical protein